MLLYSLRIAWQNIVRHPGFYAINMAGLAIGLAACIIISHYVFFHKSFDTFQPYSERTYRLNYARTTQNGEYIRFASATPIIGRILSEQLPQIELLGMAYKIESMFLYNDNYNHDHGFFSAETSMIELLGLEIVHGQAANALDRPEQIIISESLAKNFFRDEDPIGQLLYLSEGINYEVSAVFKDIPRNSHFKADGFLSMEVMRNAYPSAFESGHFMSGFYNYLRLAEGVDPAGINAMIREIIDEVYEQELQQHKFEMEILLQPVEEIHLYSNYHHEISSNGSYTAIRMLGIIAWFILIIAWANYFNLSSIKILKRTRETAIRQVNGASPLQIRVLYMGESAIVSLMAIVMALIIAEVSASQFSAFANVPPISPVWQHSWIFLICAIVFLIGTITALIHSSVSLSTESLVREIKGIAYSVKGRGVARKVMLTVQFALALGLILSSLTIYRQYHYISNHEKGFRSDGILVMKLPLINDSLSLMAYQSFRNELTSIPAVQQFGFSTVVPGNHVDHNIGGLRLEGQDEDESRNLRLLYTEASYFDVYGIPLLAGEMFSGISSIDSAKVILNETSVRNFGLSSPAEAVGKRIFRGPFTFHIIGVVADIHQVSPKMVLEPLIYMAAGHHNGFISLHLTGGSASETLNRLEDIYISYFPRLPLHTFWMEEHYRAGNDDERSFGMVFGMFSGLALLITLLGIMSVAAYTARQRQKEIAIRKTLGASPGRIFRMLFGNYLILILIASVLIFPVSYLWLDHWLGQFHTRVNINAISLFMPLLLVIATTFFTVWIQSMQVLRVNPSEVLKE